MPRVPKYRKHSRDNYAFIEHNGERIRLAGAYNSAESKANYQQVIRSILGASPIDLIIQQTGARITVAMLAASFLVWCREYYTRSNEADTIKASIKRLVAFAGDLPADEFGPKKLKEFRDSLTGKSYKKPNGEKVPISRDYINRCLKHTRQMFKHGVAEEMIPPATLEALKAVPPLRKGAARETEPRTPVAWEHVEPVLAELWPGVAAMVLLQWHTGARGKSICQATPAQFSRSVTPWVWRPRHKTEHLDRKLTIYVGPQARKILTPLLDARQPDEYLFRPADAPRARHHATACYNANSYRTAVVRAIERVNRQRDIDKAERIPYWTPHQLRHAKATAVRAAHGLEASQAVLGHESIDATQIYAQRLLDVAKKIAEADG